MKSLAGFKVSQHIRFRQHPTMTACWAWTGYVSPAGLAQACGTTARRVVWTKMRGYLRDDERLHDLCGYDDCVNPHHMRVRVCHIA
jgi:hypothetical protein